ncbi:MAG: 1-acyl-sn-glycerol-3-phosphate acyltransferase [Spirochaetaceae bacterium]|jgi:1-acyl-sn-glycerol-3-phosphate acyltransferase|nr:1-acyl-sn-glycerol-3-phosphate acyltransferase [Spirochaetaceae bacterium]
MIKRFFVTLYSFCAIGFGVVIFIPIVIVLSVTNLIGLRRMSNKLIYKIVKFASKIIVFGIGFKLFVSGQKNIPPRGKTGLCFVCNHSGILDILLLLITAGRPLGFISKKEIVFVPFINLWLMLLGGIFMDRNNPRKALIAINNGIKKIKSGHSMAIFPEGTRSRGQGLLPFKTGSFRLATAAGADIVPVAISGTYDAFEKTGWVQPGPVCVSFGKAIETSGRPDGSETRQYFSDQTRAEIDLLLKQQAKEHPPRP